MTAGVPTIGGLKRLKQFLAGQLITAVNILGGTINNTSIGQTTAAAGSFTTVSATTVSAASVASAGNVTIGTAANTLVLKQGANGKVGTFTANGVATVTVNNTSVTANSAIIPYYISGSLTNGAPYVKSKTPGSGFTVGAGSSDNSVYGYIILETAA